jgi:hypothetical protein
MIATKDRGKAYRVTLYVDKRKKKPFLQMLSMLEFVEVESEQQQLDNYIKNAPINVPISEDEISELITENRRTKRSK